MKKHTAIRLLAFSLAALLLIGGFSGSPARAEEDYGAVYEQMDMSRYWSESEKTAPVKTDYVFGGWYTKSGEEYSPLTALSSETTYAKFVPAQVLSVKAQVAQNTNAETTLSSVRVFTSVDSLNYDKIGIYVQLGKQSGRDYEATTVYGGLKAGEKTLTVKDIFGTGSRNLAVWQIKNIGKQNFNKTIYVRPYWVTLDGTRVNGLGRYIHVEDSYRKYISVPVNLMSGDGFAAGRLRITCTTDGVKPVDVKNGKLGTEMDYHISGNTVTIVANGEQAEQAVTADGVFASVRFEKPENVSGNLTFTVNGENFWSWTPEAVTIDGWDYIY